jgi:hypothetical protein
VYSSLALAIVDPGDEGDIPKAGIQEAQSLGDSARQPLGGVWGKEAWEASRDHKIPFFQGWGGEEKDS